MSGGAGNCQHKKIHLFLYNLCKFFTLFFHNSFKYNQIYILLCFKKNCQNFVIHCKNLSLCTVLFFLSYCKVYCKIIYLYSTVLSLSLCMYYIFFCIFLLYYVLQSLHIYNHKFYRSNTNILFRHFILICFF